MKVVILAGGMGTRISEESSVRPKPMVEIGGKPVLWHIMKIYSKYGFNDFVICLGHKGNYIKDWMNDYHLHNSDCQFDFGENKIKFLNKRGEDWKVTLIDTGESTMTGGRLKRIRKYIGNKTFMATYGDGIGDINVKELLKNHRKYGKLATLTAVIPEGRFGTLNINNRNRITRFSEKTDNQNRVNAGFFVFEPEVFDYIQGDDTTFENEPLQKLTSDGQLCAHIHDGFWRPMDTLNDKNILEKIWQSGSAPWKVW